MRESGRETMEREGATMLKRVLKYCAIFVLSLGVLFYAVTSWVLVTNETDLVFHPHEYDASTPLEQRPQILPTAENVEFLSADGLKLHGYFLQSGDFIDQNTIPVLFCHGNGGNCVYTAGWFFFDLQPMNEDGKRGPSRFAMLSFDYRSYGFSEGKKSDLSEKTVCSDARAARKWLSEKCAKNERDVVLMGHSLGGGVAAELALDGTPRLILLSTFDSVPDTALSYCPILPAKLCMRNQFASSKKLPKIHVPLLQFHDPNDQIVPFRNGKRLFTSANEPKEFVVLHGMNHNYTPNPEMRAKIVSFLERTF